jgi:hypothetical protein
MNYSYRGNLNRQIIFCLILALIITAGCSHVQVERQAVSASATVIKRIALIGFKTAVYQSDESDDASVSMSYNMSPQDPVLIKKSLYLTPSLFEVMTEYKGYELIGPEITGGVFSKIAASGQGISNVEIAGRTARELQADAAIIGYLYRWKEREGSDYAVNSPASVFYNLYLVSPDNGSVLWKGQFNKTQRSLSENLLDIRTFFKGKGKWMTADDLAVMGMKDLIDDLILFMEKGKEGKN